MPVILVIGGKDMRVFASSKPTRGFKSLSYDKQTNKQMKVIANKCNVGTLIMGEKKYLKTAEQSWRDGSEVKTLAVPGGWCIPLIPALGRQARGGDRQEDLCEFKANLVYRGSPR